MINRTRGFIQNDTIIGQVKVAFQTSNRLATIAGFLIGGFVPLATFFVSHFEVDAKLPLYSQMPVVLVLGGLFFSAKTVYEWARNAFKHPIKALGFVLLTEGVMTFSSSLWLSIAALAYLVAINGTATACTLVMDYRKKKE